MTPALILDILLLGILILSALFAWKQGFVSTLIELGGTVVSLAVSYLAVNKLTPQLFEQFFKSGLIAKTHEVLVNGEQGTVQTMLEGIASFLPKSLADQLLGNASAQLDQLVNANAPNMAEQVVQTVIMPLILPLISVVVFFVAFALCNLLVRLARAAFANLNRVPLVGGANRAFGLVLGLVLGAMRIMLALCVVWAVQVVLASDTNLLETSFFYSLFAGFDPFI